MRDVVKERGREFVNKTYSFFFSSRGSRSIYTHAVCFLALLSKRRLFFFFLRPLQTQNALKEALT